MNQNQELNADEAQVGRILHFVIENGWGLKCRPAIVVEDWPGQGKPGYVNLQVFTDGKNDGTYGTDKHSHGYTYRDGEMIIGGPSNVSKARTEPVNESQAIVWETSVMPNHAVRAHRTWHWPRECPSMQAPKPPFSSDKTQIARDRGKVHHNHGEGVVDTHNCYACILEAEYKDALAQG